MWPQGAAPNGSLSLWQDTALTSGLRGARLASYECYDLVLSLSLQEKYHFSCKD